ncbi:MAG: amino-acid N-acetyltransferase [Proteobacteria bacterium]|nr:amino-acid N-acetyltransferase [Pseudomonadota bacterium]
MTSTSLFQTGSFRQAAHYIHTHRGKTFVVYINSRVLLADTRLTALIRDLALMHTLGAKLVLVLGDGASISRETVASEQSAPHHTLHVTDHDAIGEIKNTASDMCENVKAFFSASLANTPLAGARLDVACGDFLQADPDADKQSQVDYPHRDNCSINQTALQQQLDKGNIVAITPMASSTAGSLLLLPGAELAMHTACVMHSEKLILVLDQFKLHSQKTQGEDHYSIEEARELVENLPEHKQDAKRYLSVAIQACSKNVKNAHLVDIEKPGTLLEELYSLDGAATLVTAQAYEEIRPATLDDLDGIAELIQPFMEKGILVARSRAQLELEIDRFDVIERDGVLLTCGVLHTFPEENVAEVGCLAVHPEFQSIGRGSKMLMHLEKKACEAGFSKLFVLTTQTEHWFQEHGFESAKIEDLPMQKQVLYDDMRKSKIYSKTIQ